MIINSELFLRTFQIIESGPLPILFILHPYYAKTFSPQKDMPPAGQAAKNPARGNLGRDIVVRISGTTGRKASLPATGILAPATVVTQKDHY